MAMLADVASALVPLVGCLVHQGQVGVEHGVACQEEEEEDHKAQHEDDPGEGEKQVLEKERERGQ